VQESQSKKERGDKEALDKATAKLEAENAVTLQALTYKAKGAV
jgi:hypothetical protein